MFRIASHWRISLVLLAAAITAVSVPAKSKDKPMPGNPAIVSPSHPKDSLGETVYEIQGESQKDIAVVPGVFLPPKVIRKIGNVNVRKRLTKDQRQDFNIVGVIDANGDFIDATLPNNAAPEVAKAVLAAIAGTKFTPATLNGKPVAVLAEIPVHIKYHAFF